MVIKLLYICRKINTIYCVNTDVSENPLKRTNHTTINCKKSIKQQLKMKNNKTYNNGHT